MYKNMHLIESKIDNTSNYVKWVKHKKVCILNFSGMERFQTNDSYISQCELQV